MSPQEAVKEWFDEFGDKEVEGKTALEWMGSGTDESRRRTKLFGMLRPCVDESPHNLVKITSTDETDRFGGHIHPTTWQLTPEALKLLDII